MDDLLVAEDLAAAETTSAASHAAAVSGTSDAPHGKSNSRRNSSDSEGTREDPSDEHQDGAVILANPVAPPINGDIYADISTENAMIHGHRYIL